VPACREGIWTARADCDHDTENPAGMLALSAVGSHCKLLTKESSSSLLSTWLLPQAVHDTEGPGTTKLYN
jgi:hypothetical protein